MANSPTGRIIGKSPLLSAPYRQASKSHMLAQMYGAAAANMQAQSARIDPEDPLEGLTNYHVRGRDKRFGNVVRYKTNNATLGLFHKEGEIGSTGVRGDKASNGVFVIAWVRAHGTERMKEAVACALLLHEHVAIIHAFEDEP